MARAKKPRALALKRSVDPDRSRVIRRALLHIAAAVMLAAGLGASAWLARGYVVRKLAFAKEPPKVVLKNRPVWMSDFLAEQIAKSARPVGVSSAFDHRLLVDTAEVLRANPWIRQVKQVRRAYSNQPGDTIEVDCEYRAPVALVHWKDYFWLVDGEGVKLPEAFAAADVPRIIKGSNGRMNIRIVEGVSQPPPESGMKWSSGDLLAGVELAKLLFGRAYTEEIVAVDVSNFGGRRDPKGSQLILRTRYNTEIRWGRPVAIEDDYFFVENSPAQKLAYLEAIHKDKGRVDGSYAWVDIRIDSPTIPNPAQTAHAEIQR